MSVLCAALFFVVAIGVPLAFMAKYLREERLFWPGITLIERSKVSVSAGAFRDATASVETQREVPAGIPLLIKLTSFVALTVGQLFPILALYAFMGLFGVVAMFVESGRGNGVAWAAAEVGLIAWTIAARSSWKSAHAVLSAHTQDALKWLRSALTGYGVALLSVVVATLIGGGLRSLDLWMFTVPFALLLVQAAAHSLMFEKYRHRLPDSVGAAYHDPETGFILSGVRVVDPMATPSTSAHESEQQSTAASADKRSGDGR